MCISPGSSSIVATDGMHPAVPRASTGVPARAHAAVSYDSGSTLPMLDAGERPLSALRPFAFAPPPPQLPLGEVVRAVTVHPVLQQVTLQVDGATGSMIFVSYTTLPGNLPTTNGNFVAVWNGTIVPWTQPPLRQMTVPGNFASGSLVIDRVQVTMNAYTVAYAVGTVISDACASSILGAGAQAAAPQSVSLSLDFVGTTSLAVHYVTLSGYLPATNGNWLGLWAGEVSPYSGTPPLARSNVIYDYSEGDVAFNAVPLADGATYTLIYFMGEAPTSASAILTFQTAGS